MSPELARELRETRPIASPELRERVLALAAQPVDPPRARFVWPVRRIALIAVPTAVAAGLAVAVVHGIVNGSHRGRAAAHSAPAVSRTGSGRAPASPSKTAPEGFRD